MTMSKKDLNDLRRNRLTAAANMQTAADAMAVLQAGDEVATADVTAAQASFDQARAAFDTLNNTVLAMEQAEAAGASAAFGDQARPAVGPVAARAQDPAMKGVDLGLTMIALANSRGDLARAAAALEAAGHSGLSAQLNTGTESAGGVLVPREMASGMIELLRPRVVVRKAGARSVPMSAGQLRHSRQSGGATAGYGAENAATAVSQPSTDKIDQSFKTLTALVPVSNALLQFSVATAQMVRDDLLRVSAQREDLGMLRDNGTGNLLKGLRHWVPAGHWQAAVTNAFASVDLALRKAVAKVADSDVPMLACGWVMRASTKEYLASLRDALGNIAYPSIDAMGTLRGYPIYTTSQLPGNLGIGGDETEIMFADFSEIMIGDAAALTISISTEAAYVDGLGNVRSAFQNDETLFKAISRHDLAPAHDVAISGISGVGWSL
jgi:HK97 family phage major capsid protein